MGFNVRVLAHTWWQVKERPLLIALIHAWSKNHITKREGIKARATRIRKKKTKAYIIHRKRSS